MAGVTGYACGTLWENGIGAATGITEMNELLVDIDFQYNIYITQCPTRVD